MAPVKFLVVTALTGVLSASPVSAQQPAAPSQPPAGQSGTPPAGQKPDYGQWWLANARDVNPKPPGWLFHIEGTASFANQSGSVSGFEYTANILSALRKGIVTNQIGGSFILQEARVEGGGGNFKQETARAFNMLYVSVGRPINLVGAFIIEKDEPKHVLHREALFAGVQRVFSFPKGRRLSMSVAGGYEHETVRGQFGEQQEGGPAAYAQSMFTAPIGQRGIFTNFIEYFHDLEISDDYRINWNASLQLQVNKHIGIGPSVQIRHDAKPVTQVQKTDTMTVLGITFK